MRLTAATAEIYGPGIVFESKYGNLGWWSPSVYDSEDDHATWSIEVSRGGAGCRQRVIAATARSSTTVTADAIPTPIKYE